MADQIHQSPTTNNKHMINQQVSQENSYWKKKKKKHFVGASLETRQKMQKLVGELLQLHQPPHNILATTNKAGHHTQLQELTPQQQRH
jgi:hypothetical protein